MKKLALILLLPILVYSISSCKKDSSTVSAAQIQVGQAISDSTPLCGAIKGTFLANKTYTVNCDITINAGDTVVIQKGVTINFKNSANLFVNGTLISLGTSDAPVVLTDPRRTKTTGPTSAATDSAFAGGWGGIWCGPTCALAVIKWTHIDFAGAALQTIPFSGPSVGDAYAIYFGNPSGYFILEDSWIYGTPDDAIRFYGGHVNLMRNTVEKFGATGGDGFNAKGGTQGNMAYNMFIGSATNATKSANDGGINPQCMIAMYNNTYVNCGFRNVKTYGARGGCIEVENNSRALAYNNLIVDCNFGYRIAGGNDVTAKVYLADTGAHTDGPIMQTKYGYNWTYVDDSATASQIVPTNIAQAVVTQPQPTDIPNMYAFLGPTYTFGATYNGSSFIGKNNPMFVNYPLPATNFRTQASIDGYNFHLQAGSPCLGKGYTGFTPIQNVPVDPNFGSSEITLPGSDIGCYQANGSGNKH